MSISFVVLTARGAELAAFLAPNFPEAQIHGRRGRVEKADLYFDDTMAHVRGLFEAGQTVVGICAAGILIRAVAPLLKDKTTEPPVLSLSENGASIVPLLGGHNGANRLAAELAEITKGHAALTTAGDVAFGVALDDPPDGWQIGNPEKAKDIMAAVLAGGSVKLAVRSGDATWLSRSALPLSDDGERTIEVTHKESADHFTLHPPVLAVGVGCERNTDPDELITLVETILSENGLAIGAIACVTSIDVKMDEVAVHELARHLGVPARFYSAAELEQQTSRLASPSDVVFAEVGCHGVSEGAALAAVGKTGELIVAKTKTKRATVAIGLADGNINPDIIGVRRGKLSVVGIGPGKPDWRTPAVTKAISQASDVVGYKLYLDLLGDLIKDKTRHMSELAQEEDRVRKALDLAAEGRDVALVCSGDAGIYALATLVFELIDHNNREDWNRLLIEVEPGVSAIQAAASRIGAPIGHDFCTISLSDLLTPWQEIERRLKAAAAGDFVVAFYNPVSKRRRHQLEIARDTLLSERPAETPVMLARNLGRDEETITYITLGELTPDHADMLTLVMVGNSQSRLITQAGQQHVYTPRGYAAKLS
jgi:cobalt-precorrin 5A hydrolase / precorrin-3B C17-methyltransferase